MNILGRAGRAAEIRPLAWMRSHAADSLARAISLIQRRLSGLTSLRQLLPPTRDVEKALVVGVAYYVGAELAFWTGTLSYFFAPLWPPNMILFAALLQAPYRSWWIYV